MPALRFLNGEMSGKVLKLTDKEVVFGRHPDCDVILPDETVSRHHARIFRTGDAYFLQDMGSRNGTALNGRKVETASRLTHLDQIQFFDTTIEFLNQPAELPRDDIVAPSPVSGNVGSGQQLRSTNKGLFETIGEIDVTDPATQTGKVNKTDVKLQAVLQITRYLRSSREPDEILSRIVEWVTQIFPQYFRSYLLKYNAQTGRLDPLAIKQKREETGGPLTLPPITQALAKQVLNDGKAVLSVGTPGDWNGDTMSSIFDDDAWSFMCAPLIGPSRQRAGILYIESTDIERRFTHSDLEVFACVAILAGQALEQATWFGARYRAVFDTAAEGIITLNAEGIIESVNPAMKRLFGYAARDLIGRSVSVLVTEQHAQVHEEFLARNREEDPANPAADREAEARRKDGSTFPIHLSIGEFELGGKRHFTWIVHDISERLRAESVLREMNETLELQVRERTESISLLQDVAMIANQSESIEQAFHTVLQRVCRFKGWEAGHVFLCSSSEPGLFVDTGIWATDRPARHKRLMSATESMSLRAGDGMIGRVAASGASEWLSDIAADESFTRREAALACGLQTVAASAVLVGSEVRAVIEFFSAGAAPADEDFLGVMQQVGTQLGRVIERDRFQRQMVDAVWDQHRRLGQELHDSLGQALTGIGMLADSLSRKLKAGGFPETDKLSELQSMIQEAKTDVRRLTKGLYPVDVDAHGLLSALDELASITEQRWQVKCVFEGDPELQISDNQVATHLFRIAQEAVHNAVKHGHPEKISISLGRQRGYLTLIVKDNGPGMSDRAVDGAQGLGMRIMQYRANAMNADLSVEQTVRGGTVVRCALKEKYHHVQGIAR